MAKRKQPRAEPFVELIKRRDRWDWILWATNGRPIAMSVTDYSRSNDAIAAFETASRLLERKIKFLVAKREIHTDKDHAHPHKRN